MKKIITGILGTVLVVALAWGALFLAVPQVKDWTYRVFRIERTAEDDTTNTEDENTDNENTDNENTGDETTEDETTTDESEEDKVLAPDYIPEDTNLSE